MSRMIIVLYFGFQFLCQTDAQQYNMCMATTQLRGCPSISVPGTDDVIKLVYKGLSSDHAIARYRLGLPSNGQDVICKLPACAENPCLHGGTCIETFEGYECLCPNGTYGSNCGHYRQKTTACMENHCQHGGTCNETVDGYECLCPSWTYGSNCDGCYSDCNDFHKAGYRNDGVYQICLFADNGSTYGPVDVLCAMGSVGKFGWTVLQKRVDGSVNFDRVWQDYKTGFGNLSTEFWLGNDFIHQLTNHKNYLLRVNIIRDDGEYLFANYKSFLVANESLDYQLTFGGFSGSAGDAMGPLNGLAFSTLDRDNDLTSTTNCAQLYGGGWFAGCDNARLNARGNQSGILGEWRVGGARTFFTRVDMKLRPK